MLVKKLTERHEADRMGLVRAQQKLEAKGLQREKDNQKLKIQVDNNKKNYVLKEEELRIQIRSLELQIQGGGSPLPRKKKPSKLSKFLNSTSTPDSDI